MATPPATVQTEATSLVTPFIISTSDPFAVLSQAVNDGSSLVVTPFSIPSSAKRGPDVDLSSKGSEDVLEDPDDEPVLKKRISDSDEEENVPPKAEFMGMPFSLPSYFCFCQVHSSPFFLSSSSLHASTCVSPFAVISLYLYAYFPAFTETFKGLGIAANIGMPSSATSATPIAPVSTIPTAPISAAPSVPISIIPAGPVSTVPSVPVSTVPSIPVSVVPIAPIPAGPVSFSSPPLFLSLKFIALSSQFLMLRFMLLVRFVAYYHFSV